MIYHVASSLNTVDRPKRPAFTQIFWTKKRSNASPFAPVLVRHCITMVHVSYVSCISQEQREWDICVKQFRQCLGARKGWGDTGSFDHPEFGGSKNWIRTLSWWQFLASQRTYDSDCHHWNPSHSFPLNSSHPKKEIRKSKLNTERFSTSKTKYSNETSAACDTFNKHILSMFYQPNFSCTPSCRFETLEQKPLFQRFSVQHAFFIILLRIKDKSWV